MESPWAPTLPSARASTTAKSHKGPLLIQSFAAEGDGRPSVAERTHTRYDAELGWVNVPGATVDDLYGQQRALIAAVLDGNGKGPVNSAVDKWIEAHKPAVERNQRLLEDLRKDDVQDLAMLTVANRQIRVLAAD